MNTEKTNTNNNLWNISYLIIVIINALSFINFNMSTSGMPAFAASLGDSNLNVGLVTTVCAISALLCRPFSGFFSDKFNSIVISTIGLLMMSVGPIIGIFSNNIFGIYILRCIQGIGWGMTSTACAKLIVICSPKQRVSEGIGYSGAISSICAAVAPGLAIMILQNFGKINLMLAIALPSLIAASLIPLYRNKKTPNENNSIRFRLNNCFEKKAILSASFVFIITLCYSPMITFVSSYAELLGINNSYWFFICYAITTIVSRPFTGKLVDKHNPFLFGVIAFVFMILSELTLFFANNLWWLLASGLFAGIGTGIGINTFQTMAVSSSTERKTGKAMATFLFGFDFGMALGSAVAGVISDRIGIKSMFLAFSFVSFFGIAGITISILFKNHNRQ